MQHTAPLLERLGNRILHYRFTRFVLVLGKFVFVTVLDGLGGFLVLSSGITVWASPHPQTHIHTHQKTLSTFVASVAITLGHRSFFLG